MKNVPIATLFNFGTVILGSIIGIALQEIFSDGIKDIVFQAVGLVTLLIGAKMAMKIPEGYILLLIFSMITGGILGEILSLDDQILAASEYLKETLSISNSNFSEGLITSFLLFCVGSLTIVGALEEGLHQNRELILLKATLDGFTSIALASTFGIGVLFSAFPLLIFQGGISLTARYLKPIFDENTIALISSTGGLLIIGIGINMLKLGTINLENLLPSLIMGVVFSKLYLLFQSKQKS